MSQQCGNPYEQSIDEQIRALYTELAERPEQYYGWSKGKDNARALGYDPGWLEQLPERVWESAAAVGNPFALGPICLGETVVDLGCGAGADACVAALLVGPTGRVLGVDLTPAMVEKARVNAQLAGFGNITIHEADIAELPLADACAEVVFSNGAINLSPRKACVVKEISRVLKPGGRLYIADMVRDPSMQPDDSAGTDSWASCVAGTLVPSAFVQLLCAAGFESVELVSTNGYRTAPETMGATFRARKTIAA